MLSALLVLLLNAPVVAPPMAVPCVDRHIEPVSQPLGGVSHSLLDVSHEAKHGLTPTACFVSGQTIEQLKIYVPQQLDAEVHVGFDNFTGWAAIAPDEHAALFTVHGTPGMVVLNELELGQVYIEVFQIGGN